MQEKITVTITQEHDQHARVENNHGELEGEWQDIYVAFSGYFGHHGPHKFAQGPVLYEALAEIVAAADGDGWSQLDPSFEKARAALKLARGES